MFGVVTFGIAWRWFVFVVLLGFGLFIVACVLCVWVCFVTLCFDITFWCLLDLLAVVFLVDLFGCVLVAYCGYLL